MLIFIIRFKKKKKNERIYVPLLHLVAVSLYLLSEAKISKPWLLSITLSSCDIRDLIFTSSKKARVGPLENQDGGKSVR